MLTLIPESLLLDEEREVAIKLPHTYFHGNIEKDNLCDSFYIMDAMNMLDNGQNLQEGVYPCTCDMNYCMLYIWDTDEGFHGLATYTSDEKANNFALKKFNAKTMVL